MVVVASSCRRRRYEKSFIGKSIVWPTLRQMIDADKRILMMSNAEWVKKNAFPKIAAQFAVTLESPYALGEKAQLLDASAAGSTGQGSSSNHIRVFRRSSNHVRVFRLSSNHVRVFRRSSNQIRVFARLHECLTVL